MHGPHPRDFHYHAPKKIARLAFAAVLNAKIADGNLMGIDSLAVSEPKTKLFKEILAALKLKGRTTFITEAMDKNVFLASRNLKEAVLKDVKDVNLMDILKSDNVVITKKALARLPERLK